MKRRSFLISTVSALCCQPVALRANAITVHSRISNLVITDVSACASVDHLITLFDVFFEHGVPFTCVVDPLKTQAGLAYGKDDLSRLLTAYALKGDFMEIAVNFPELSFKSEYFQARGARDRIYELQNILLKHRRRISAQTHFTTVACDDVENPEEPTGVRSAGIRSVLVVPRSTEPVRSENWNNGVVRFYGGKRLNLESYEKVQIEESSNVTQSIYYLSALELESIAIGRLAQQANNLAADLIQAETMGKNSVQRISDVLLRDNYSFQRHISVHLATDDRTRQEDLDLVEQFSEELSEAGFPVSIGNLAVGDTREQNRIYWIPSVAANHQLGAKKLKTVLHDGSFNSYRDEESPLRRLPPGHAILLVDLNDEPEGLNEHAVLSLPCLDVSNVQIMIQIDEHLAHTSDAVLLIRPEAIKPAFARAAVIRKLISLARRDYTEFVPISALGRSRMPSGPEMTHQRRTLVSRLEAEARPRTPSQVETDLLVQDAKVAWSYFEQNTIDSTGLCPATVNYSAGGETKHSTVTMWDVGSHINALIAASKIGLVSRKEFDRRISQILTQIRGRESQGRLLPQGWLRVDRQKWGNRDFDGSDAGRLLAALYGLREFAGFDDRLTELVGTWDLDKTVIDGHVHSVVSGELVSVFRSHSAHYAALAFRRWGVDALSPYEQADELTAYDRQVALLETVSWIGPLGAEPLLLEAMELGMSEPSSYLAEVLFAAQYEEFLESGRPIAVSEGPIDVAPWFTYQGLQIDATERTWALDTVGHDENYMTREFWKQHLVLSSKAAFLWASYKPHDYSFFLRDFVRERCRTKRGFASSIFDHNGRVTTNYTDINTNAVILQAIAKALVDAE
ncbi:DUF3131 domain-containing protein [Aestuariivita boseongensis]|uniref:DUF3131 domain-containing protein n=1 Tax=Aestuariivita boseongensis TaxID=1470562 RepID=UPI0012FB9842|nr:DUF3131 domain-containing protein [Aestuariivita boseongensis]